MPPRFSNIPPDSVAAILGQLGLRNISSLAQTNKNTRNIAQPLVNAEWAARVDDMARNLLKGLQDILRIHRVVKSTKFVMPKRLHGKVSKTPITTPHGTYGNRPFMSSEGVTFWYDLSIGTVTVGAHHWVRFPDDPGPSIIIYFKRPMNTEVFRLIYFEKEGLWKFIPRSDMKKSRAYIGLLSTIIKKKPSMRFDINDVRERLVRLFGSNTVMAWDKYQVFAPGGGVARRALGVRRKPTKRTFRPRGIRSRRIVGRRS